jgi:hypothetical protein
MRDSARNRLSDLFLGTQGSTPGASKTFAYEQVDELTGILRLTTFDNAGRLRSCFLRQLSFVTSLSLVDSR